MMQFAAPSATKVTAGHSLVLVLGLFLVSGASAWGGLFNRYNPSMLSNLNLGYGKELYGVAEQSAGHPHNDIPNIVEELLEEEARLEAASAAHCSGKKCTANEHCCDGHVCVDADETTGTCLPIWGKKQGEYCYRDSDCESGFLCMDNGYTRACQSPAPGNKHLGEDCRTSSDCNVSKGLCCKLTRRAKSQPKKICSYFADPQTCIGPVAADQVISTVEHTAGEKRVSGHPDDYLHTRK